MATEVTYQTVQELCGGGVGLEEGVRRYTKLHPHDLLVNVLQLCQGGGGGEVKSENL